MLSCLIMWRRRSAYDRRRRVYVQLDVGNKFFALSPFARWQCGTNIDFSARRRRPSQLSTARRRDDTHVDHATQLIESSCSGQIVS